MLVKSLIQIKKYFSQKGIQGHCGQGRGHTGFSGTGKTRRRDIGLGKGA